MYRPVRDVCVAAFIAACLGGATALAQPLAMTDPTYDRGSFFQQIFPQRELQPLALPAEPAEAQTPAHLRRQTVSYPTHEAPGTIVIDSASTYLYYVLGGGRAVRYGIGVGREGFGWSGVRAISAKQEWPDWHPPAEMIARQPYLPRFMAGGVTNPLGARALYLGGTLYRIHGTNAPQTIGQRVSSGCFRMLNEDVIDLYSRVHVGTKVVVLPDTAPRSVRTAAAPAPRVTSTVGISQIDEPAALAPRPIASAPPPFLSFGSSASRLY